MSERGPSAIFMLKLFHLLDFHQGLRRRFRTRPSTPSGVLLMSCGGLGDTVLFAYVLPRFLEMAHNGETVTLLLRGDARKMEFLFPPEITVRDVDFRRLAKDLFYRRRICEALFQAHYRLLVATDFLRHPYLDEVLAAACGAPESAAMEPRPWRKYDSTLRRNRRLYSRLFDSGPAHLDKVVRWSRFAEWLTGTTGPPPLARLAETHLPPPARLNAPAVVIQPFSAVKRKQIPLSIHQRIIDSLPAAYRVVLTGAAQDLDRNPEYRVLLENPRVAFDSSSFEEVVPLLRAADLVVSVDTALMHLGIAVGAKTLCLASAAFVGEIVPYDAAISPENAHFLYHSMPCEGCLGACVLPPEMGMFPCVARLEGDEIINKVKELLERPAG